MSVTLPINVSTRRMAAVTCTAGQTAIPYNFPLLRQDDIRVTRTRAGVTAELVQGVDFTVSGVGAAAGGTVTLITGATAGDIIAVDGDAAISRLSSIIQAGRFSSAQIDLELDLAVIRDQELRRDVDGKLAQVISGPGISTSIDEQGNLTITNIGVPNGGSGNVVGPASALNNSIVLYDGTTGRLLKDGGPLRLRRRNLNGDMRIDQQQNGAAVSIPALGVNYPVDAWAVYNAGGGTISAQRVAGQGGFVNALRVTGAAGNTGVTVFNRNEASEVADLAGKTVTLQVQINASADRSITWYLAHPAATADVFSSVTVIATGIFAATATPNVFTATVTLPASAARGIEIGLQLGAMAATNTVDVTGVQLEEGSLATAFERRPFALEDVQCKRLYQNFGANEAAGAFVSSTAAVLIRHFPVMMRATPTVVFPPLANALNSYFNGNWTPAAMNAAATPRALWMGPTGTGGFATGIPVTWAGGTVQLDARL